MFNFSIDSPKISFSCCNRMPEERVAHSCQSYAQLMASPEFKPLLGFLDMNPETVYASCITLGYKKYQMKGTKCVYKQLAKDITEYCNKRASPAFYIFELTKSGQLHAHGIEQYDTEGLFRNTFQKYGSWNFNGDKAYEKIQSIQRYIHYMTKEQLLNEEYSDVFRKSSTYWYKIFKPVCRVKPQLPLDVQFQIERLSIPAYMTDTSELDAGIQASQTSPQCGGREAAIEPPPEGEARSEIRSISSLTLDNSKKTEKKLVLDFS